MFYHVMVLKNTEEFKNRPAYFADIKWNVNRVPVATLFAEAKQMWDEDTVKGVKERLSTKAYQYLGTYGVFEEQNRYGGDFSGKVEKGWEKDVGELREGFHNLLEEFET